MIPLYSTEFHRQVIKSGFQSTLYIGFYQVLDHITSKLLILTANMDLDACLIYEKRNFIEKNINIHKHFL